MTVYYIVVEVGAGTMESIGLRYVLMLFFATSKFEKPGYGETHECPSSIMVNFIFRISINLLFRA